ncbi:endonuclease domain-containing protein [Brachybacterium hainanense]|uniref:Endonuclease domain-containing protein n=1 Tax=Brachybacterium hainanense TaxID=1541174 RepID=A0ABV6REG7_9MICO
MPRGRSRGAALGSDGLWHLIAVDDASPTRDVPCCGDGILSQPDGLELTCASTGAVARCEQPQCGDVHLDPSRAGGLCCPWTVPRSLRCGGAERWPRADLRSSSRLRGIAFRLLARFGHTCQACRLSDAHVVDHDHVSGLVRGLICGDCNLRIETCLHLDGCGFSSSLNAPPALPLRLLCSRSPTSAERQRLLATALLLQQDPELARCTESLSDDAPLFQDSGSRRRIRLTSRAGTNASSEARSQPLWEAPHATRGLT